MFVSIRRYHSPDVAEVARRVEDGFLPLIQQSPGFIAYYLLDCGDGWLSTISMFADQTGAEGSAYLAADWVRDNIAPWIDAGPEVVMGQTLVSQVS